ncbi:MAG: hypothetical protein GY793_03895 [Proteobacteria bacterium]|nr:hypothetical protein [Pseudomonadota bacterium]
MHWYTYALLYSLFFMVIPIKKRRIIASEENLLFWSSGFVFFLLLMLTPLMELPKSGVFYVIGSASGMLGVLGGILQISLSKAKKGRVLPIQMLCQIIACFIFYCMLKPEYFQEVIGNPIESIIAILSVILIIITSFFLRENDITIRSVATILPVSLLFAFILAYYKVIITTSTDGIENIIFVYVMAHFFTLFIALLIKNLVQPENFIVTNEKLVSDSLIIALFYVFGYYFLFLAIYYASNPAYVLVFNLLIPVWIKLYGKITKKQDDAKLNAVIIILALVGVMILTT